MKNLLKLVNGYQNFKAHYFKSDNNSLFENLAEEGQQPKTLVIACCDSRVDPAILTNCKPGELFVVRNVANLVPPYDNDAKHHGTSAAIEFAVQGLGVRHIIILGHSDCGGIQALLKSKENDTGFVSSWMAIAKQAKLETLAKYKDKLFTEQSGQCEKLALITSLNNLVTFPWIKQKLENDDLMIHAWHFDIKSGQIEYYDIQNKQFNPLEQFLIKEEVL